MFHSALRFVVSGLVGVTGFFFLGLQSAFAQVDTGYYKTFPPSVYAQVTGDDLQSLKQVMNGLELDLDLQFSGPDGVAVQAVELGFDVSSESFGASRWYLPSFLEDPKSPYRVKRDAEGTEWLVLSVDSDLEWVPAFYETLALDEEVAESKRKKRWKSSDEKFQIHCTRYLFPFTGRTHSCSFQLRMP